MSRAYHCGAVVIIYDFRVYTYLRPTHSQKTFFFSLPLFLPRYNFYTHPVNFAKHRRKSSTNCTVKLLAVYTARTWARKIAIPAPGISSFSITWHSSIIYYIFTRLYVRVGHKRINKAYINKRIPI